MLKKIFFIFGILFSIIINNNAFANVYGYTWDCNKEDINDRKVSFITSEEAPSSIQSPTDNLNIIAHEYNCGCICNEGEANGIEYLNIGISSGDSIEEFRISCVCPFSGDYKGENQSFILKWNEFDRDNNGKIDFIN